MTYYCCAIYGDNVYEHNVKDCTNALTAKRAFEDWLYHEEGLCLTLDCADGFAVSKSKPVVANLFATMQ